jgi:iron complex transport system permease protein
VKPTTALLILAGIAALAVVLFLTVNAKGRWGFVLSFRGTKVLAMVLVAYAVAISTVLFQTVTHNRILTPAIMGFDALYILVQTTLVLALGAAGLSALDPSLLFGIEVAAMLVFAATLYRWLLSSQSRNLHLLVLVGIVFGVLFRSLSGFMQRIIDPNEFVILQDRFFANFNTVEMRLLAISGLVIGAASLASWRLIQSLDVLTLGRDASIGLGIDYGRTTTCVLLLVAILVSVSTALVGPVTFFGLLVAHLAYRVVSTHRHAFILPAAFLAAVICLVGGQLVLEQVFALDTALSIVIDFAGGLVLLTLLIRGIAR